MKGDDVDVCAGRNGGMVVRYRGEWGERDVERGTGESAGGEMLREGEVKRGRAVSYFFPP